MISNLGVYLMFFILIVLSFAILYFVLFGQDQNGNFYFFSIFFSQFDQATSGANFDVAHLSGEEGSMWFGIQAVLILFTVLTIIVLFNLVIAVVTSAYEDGVAQSSSWWAFTQLTMIHDDDFKDTSTSPIKYLQDAFKDIFMTKLFGRKTIEPAELRKKKDEEYDRIWHIKKRKTIITESDLIRMNTKEISES